MPDTPQRRAVADPAQIRLLSSPVRQEMLDILASLGGTASVAELAEQLGRPADGLYYHLRALAGGGLVEEAKSDTGDESRYRLVGEGSAPVRLAYAPGAGGNGDELRAFTRGLLQIASRDFDDAIRREDVVVDGARRELWASRNKGWLSPDDLEEVNGLLERLSALTSQARAPGREQLTSLAFVLAPVSPRPKRRPKAVA